MPGSKVKLFNDMKSCKISLNSLKGRKREFDGSTQGIFHPCVDQFLKSGVQTSCFSKFKKGLRLQFRYA